MTTIAYKQGVVACDKQATNNGVVSRGSYKATTSPDGKTIYFITGTLTRGLKFVEWLVNGGREQEDEAPKLKKTVVLELDMKTGKAQLWEDDIPLPIEDRIAAFGSGGDIALGAMASGASPQEAVNISSRWDDGTGLGVQVYISDVARKRLEREK